MAKERVPTLRAAWLGQELRSLREEHDVHSTEIAQYLGKSQSSISRLENGLYPAQTNEVNAYLDICSVEDQHRRADLFKMCDDVAQHGWWDGYGRDIANILIDRTWIEARASRIQTCDLTYFPGLLQTPEYARALFNVGNPDANSRELAQWMDFRMTRQHVITRHNPVKLHCLIDGNLLKRRTGGADVMNGQLDFLIAASQRPNVTIQVLPAEECNGVTGPFEIMKLVEPYPQVGFVASSAGDICVEGDSISKLIRTYDRLMDAALPPEASIELINAERNKPVTNLPISWRTSSRSGGGSDGSNCVEVGTHRSRVAVRDTKNRSGGSLSIDTPEWSSLIASIKDGSL